MKFTAKQLSKLFFSDHCYYHITPTDNMASILETGLKMENEIGICTVIVNDPVITRYIIESQLRNTGKEDFTVIKICPNRHPLLYQNLVLDGSLMLSNALHLYLRKETLFI